VKEAISMYSLRSDDTFSRIQEALCSGLDGDVQSRLTLILDCITELPASTLATFTAKRYC